ncbi:MAG: asparagine synthase (glutamine-hydrolyzing) [Cyclobacteriaceae bacterium]
MCGIAGIMAFNEIGRLSMINLAKATATLESRGPDNQGLFNDSYVGLGHRRLSIIDTSSNANQPLSSKDQKHYIVYNGEIYNFKELKEELIADNVSFQSNSDSEVVLQLFIKHGPSCLEKLNGFFSFAIYNKEEQSIFLARDRFGIKPLYYLFDDDKFIFGSTLESVSSFYKNPTLDYASLHHYFQLNYIPAPSTVLSSVKKLEAGHYLIIQKKEIQKKPYYTPTRSKSPVNYQEATIQLKKLLEKSVCDRLVSDVPLGAFLSGGIDSSVIVSLAAKHKEALQTFSIGFKDNAFFDESTYAQSVADKNKTDHHTFMLSNTDLQEHVHDMLDSLDEPFADSSSLPVYILSKLTSKHVKVALSGDGADELFAGYNKYSAEHRVTHQGILEKGISSLSPLWKLLPKSRNGFLSNKIRQFDRFAKGTKLTTDERYWKWCSFLNEYESASLLQKEHWTDQVKQTSLSRKKELVHRLQKEKTDINDILLSDVNLVLQNDMLTKVDRMSMAHGLEVRVPFLDHKIVDFAFSLPEEYKINKQQTKQVLKDAFSNELPTDLINRPKKGFEVPLLHWLRNDLNPLIEDKLLRKEWIEEQNIFDHQTISFYKKKLHSSNPSDSHAVLWALLVFQWWYAKHIN